MTIAIWFWIIFVIATVFFGWFGWSNRTFAPYTVVVWILLLLLGLASFGSPIK